jgi:hypothetical protein
MPIVATRRMALWDHSFVPGDPVPADVWGRLPMDRQRVLIGQHYAEVTLEVPVEKRRPKGAKTKKPRKRRA